MPKDVVRIGAVADVHYGRDAEKRLRSVFEEAARQVDILLLGGDLTDFGIPEEAQVLARDLTDVVRIPIVAVLGNHDYESGKEQEICSVLRDAGIRVLDGDAVEIKGVGIVGVKGFGGGFGRGILEPWGEAGVKRFVHEAVEEGLKLERALARLHSNRRVALLHYSPVRETVVGEPEEIFPYLGCGRLEEPLNRYGVSVVFHGHAHRGAPEGKTATGVPVYNVALPVLKRVDPDRLPVKIIELDVGHGQGGDESAAAPELVGAAG
jgi:Icc-related predicted phosphoesterase